MAYLKDLEFKNAPLFLKSGIVVEGNVVNPFKLLGIFGECEMSEYAAHQREGVQVMKIVKGQQRKEGLNFHKAKGYLLEKLPEHQEDITFAEDETIVDLLITIQGDNPKIDISKEIETIRGFFNDAPYYKAALKSIASAYTINI